MTSATVEVTYEDGTTAVFDAWTWTRSALGCGDPIAPAAAVVVVTP